MSRKNIAVVLVLLLAACSPPPKPLSGAQAIQQHEVAAIDKLNFRGKYKDVVLGDNVQGQTLLLYVDRNNIESMDQTTEEAMLQDVLAHWKAIWHANHRRRSARVHVSVRDFYGDELERRSAHVAP